MFQSSYINKKINRLHDKAFRIVFFEGLLNDAHNLKHSSCKKWKYLFRYLFLLIKSIYLKRRVKFFSNHGTHKRQK